VTALLESEYMMLKCGCERSSKQLCHHVS